MNLLVATKSCGNRAHVNRQCGEDTVALLDFGRCMAQGHSCPTQVCEFTRSHIGTSRELAFFDTDPQGVVTYTCAREVPFGGGEWEAMVSLPLPPSPHAGRASYVTVDPTTGHRAGTPTRAPLVGWWAVPILATRGGCGGIFAPPPGVDTRGKSGLGLLRALCGPAASAPTGSPAMFNREPSASKWVSTEAGHATAPLDPGEQLCAFALRVHGVEIGVDGVVDSVYCTATVLSSTETEKILSNPSSFSSGYLASINPRCINAASLMHRAAPESVRLCKALVQHPLGEKFQGTMHTPGGGPLLLSPQGGGPPTPFCFVPHTIPHLFDTTGAKLYTGLGMPFVVTTDGTVWGPTSGAAKVVPSKESTKAATRRLRNLSLDVLAAKPMPKGAKLAAARVSSNSKGAVHAARNILAATPQLMSWATGDPTYERRCGIGDVWGVATGKIDLDPLLASARGEVCQLFRAIGDTLTPGVTQTRSGAGTQAPVVSVMKAIACPTPGVESIVVLATPLDNHKGTQNKAIVLLEVGGSCVGERRLHFYDPLTSSDCNFPMETPGADHPLYARSSLFTALSTSYGQECSIRTIDAVWALGSTHPPSVLSNPWNNSQVSDGGNYANFCVQFNGDKRALARVACNNRCHPGLPPGRVERIGTHDSPSPRWSGIEIIQFEHK